MNKEDQIINYRPAGPVAREFHRSDSFVRGLMGPIGSGKSSACVMEILRRAQQQKPSPDGVRRSRWAIIRNTFPELKTTTLKTWGDWCPQEFGKLTMSSPVTHHIQTPDLDIEVLFLALDRDEDARKLLSLELTGAWVNEAREIPKSIIDALTGRVGRYPSKSQGGASWYGIILDTNPPDSEHWWYVAAEGETPEGWEFFKQPAGTSEQAENVSNLPDGYYKRLSAGKDPDWVKVYVNGEYGFVIDGKPVYPMYRDRVHVADEKIEAVEKLPLLLGVDFGLTPAAIIGQKLVDGRWLILDEVTAEDCGIIRFAEVLGSYISLQYPDHEVEMGWGDPAGSQRAQTDERTALDLLRENTGWKWVSAPSNDNTMRREVVVSALNRLVDGNPGILISPHCGMLRKGFTGGYHFKSVRSGNGATYSETPAKNQYSHPHDALQYLLLGGGEHNVVMNRIKRTRQKAPHVAKDVDYDIFSVNR